MTGIDHPLPPIQAQRSKAFDNRALLRRSTLLGLRGRMLDEIYATQPTKENLAAESNLEPP